MYKLYCVLLLFAVAKLFGDAQMWLFFSMLWNEQRFVPWWTLTEERTKNYVSTFCTCTEDNLVGQSVLRLVFFFFISCRQTERITSV